MIGFILAVLFKDRKQTLDFLLRILNYNFNVKVSKININRVLMAHDIEWTKPKLIPNFYERIMKSKNWILQILPLYNW